MIIHLHFSTRRMVMMVILGLLLFGNASSLPLGAAPPEQTGPRTGAYLGDRVWQDANANGIQDENESGIAGIRVELYNAVNNQLLGFQITDANGSYAFFFNPSGTTCTSCYLSVDRQELLTAGYAITKQHQYNVSDIYNSDFSQIDGKTVIIPILWQYLYANFDLGLIRIPECASSYDIVLALDFSESLGNSAQSDIRYLTNFAQVVTRGFNISPTATQIGVVGFAAANNDDADIFNSRVEIDLNRYPNDREALINAIGSITRTSDRKYSATSLWEGLHLSQGLFLQGRDVPNIIIMVSDLNDNEGHGNGNPIGEADTIKKTSTLIFIVKLALSPQTAEEARKIANYTNGIPTTNTIPYVIGGNLANSTDLINVAITTITAVCSGGANAPLRNYYTTSTPTLTWTYLSNVTAYEIQVADNSSFNNPVYINSAVPQNTPSVTISALPDKRYFWRIRGVISPNRFTPWSVTDSFTIDAVPG